tara:strand:+ start:366 stop:599 length:234 start_codon:yes stop_codon:yes gene_type:complete
VTERGIADSVLKSDVLISRRSNSCSLHRLEPPPLGGARYSIAASSARRHVIQSGDRNSVFESVVPCSCGSERHCSIV